MVVLDQLKGAEFIFDLRFVIWPAPLTKITNFLRNRQNIDKKSWKLKIMKLESIWLVSKVILGCWIWIWPLFPDLTYHWPIKPIIISKLATNVIKTLCVSMCELGKTNNVSRVVFEADFLSNTIFSIRPTIMAKIWSP